MLKVHLNNDITMILNEEHVKEAIALWLCDNTAFLRDETSDFDMEFEGIEPTEPESVEEDKPEAEGDKPKQRRKRRTKEQIEADNAKEKTEAKTQETTTEEEEPTPVLEKEPVRDLLQEVIDETPEEDILDEIVAEAMANEEILEPTPAKDDGVLDLTASIFG